MTRNEGKYADRLRLFELSLDLFCISGFDGQFTDVSPSWTATLDYSEAELCARPFIDFVHPEDIASTIAETEKLTQDDGSTVLFENRYRHKNGSYRVFHWAAKADMQRQRIYAVARDVTELRDTQSRLRESQLQLAKVEKLAALGQMSAGIAHEINNPLLVIKGYAEQLRPLVSAGESTDPRITKYLDKIDRNCERMAQIVGQMLDYPRYRGSELRPTDLNESIRDVARLLEESLRSRSIKLELKLADEPALVMGNEHRIEQLLVNLVHNSRDAFADQSADQRSERRINICCDILGEELRLAVIDNGSGIDARIVPKVFDPFFTTKAPGSGTGLGLSIVHEIAQELSGRVECHAVKGDGTTMTLVVPRHLKADSKP